MKGILDYLMNLTGTGPYAIENIKKREELKQRPNVKVKKDKLPTAPLMRKK